MIRRPPRSTQSRSSAASDVYKRQVTGLEASPDDGPHAVRTGGVGYGGEVRLFQAVVVVGQVVDARRHVAAELIDDGTAHVTADPVTQFRYPRRLGRVVDPRAVDVQSQQ